MSRIDKFFGRALAVTSRFSVDSIVSSLNQSIAALDNTSVSLTARANKSYSRAAELEKRGDTDSLNADRALRVASKLRALVD